MAALAALAALALPSGATAVSHEPAGGGKQAVLDYWTPERMRNAEPRDLLSGSAPAGAGAAAARSKKKKGLPGSIPPSDPTVGAAAAGPRAGSQPASTPGDAFEVVDPDLAPNTVHGKVFGKDLVGEFECSATAVTSENRSVVFTAGHCVRLFPFGWARKFVFVPSYSHGRQPFGAWAAQTLRAPARWVRRQHENFDVAAVTLAPQAGVPVQDAVGGAGFAWNQPRGLGYSSFGYPANFFNGQRMMGCSSGARHRRIDFGRGPAMVAMTCDMGEGSSGGGWLLPGGLLNSVQALGGRRSLAVGPYFGKAARRLLFRAQAE